MKKRAVRRNNRWGEGPVIMRVPLLPEQAVLGCCSNVAGAVRMLGPASRCVAVGGAGANYSCASSPAIKGANCGIGSAPLQDNSGASS